MNRAFGWSARQAPPWLLAWCLCLFLLPFKQVFPGPVFVALQMAAVALCLLDRGPKAPAGHDRVFLLSGMMVVVCLSYFVSLSREDSQMPLLRVGVAYLCYVVLTSVRLASQELDLALRSWMWGGSAVALLAIYSHSVLGVDEDGRPVIMLGDVGADPNFLVAEMLLPFAIAFYLIRKRAWRWEAIVAIGLITYTAVICQSRGGAIAMLAVGMVLLASARRWKTLAVAIVLVAGLYVGAGENLGRFYLGNDTTGSQRTVVWSVLLPVGFDHWLTGVGLDASRVAARSAAGFYQPLEPHNTYLQAFVETGLPGLLLFLAICAVHLRLRGSHRAMPALRAGLWGLLVAGLFLHLMAYQYLWLTLAVLAQAAGARPDDAEQPPPEVPGPRVRVEVEAAPRAIGPACQQA